MPLWFLTVAAFVFGLLIGSFLNACAYRVPRGISIAHGRSFCPHCHTQIQARDNIPLVSWLLLRGHCRACGAPISARYPVVEALTAVLFAAMAVHDGWTWVLVPNLIFIAVLVLVADIDLAERIIPDVVVLPAAAVGLVLMIAIEPSHWLEWVVAGLAAAGFLLAASLIYERVRKVEGMGMGDVKLALCMGVYLGSAVVPAMFLAFVIGAVVGIVVILHGGSAKSAIPFGPFLAAGSIIALFVGQPLVEGYLHTLGY